MRKIIRLEILKKGIPGSDIKSIGTRPHADVDITIYLKIFVGVETLDFLDFVQDVEIKHSMRHESYIVIKFRLFFLECVYINLNIFNQI